MTLVGFLGVCLSLLGFSFAPMRRTGPRLAAFTIAWLAHLAGTLVYYKYVQSHPADAWLYYNDPLHWYYTGGEIGTTSTITFVQIIKLTFGGTFFDFFMIFQSIGFI